MARRVGTWLVLLAAAAEASPSAAALVAPRGGSRRAAAAPPAFVGALEDFDLKQTVADLPKTVRTSLSRFRAGCGEMFANNKRAKVVRQRLAAAPAASPLTYAELQLLRRSGEDFSKLLRVGFLWLFAPRTERCSPDCSEHLLLLGCAPPVEICSPIQLSRK